MKIFNVTGTASTATTVTTTGTFAISANSTGSGSFQSTDTVTVTIASGDYAYSNIRITSFKFTGKAYLDSKSQSSLSNAASSNNFAISYSPGGALSGNTARYREFVYKSTYSSYYFGIDCTITSIDTSKGLKVTLEVEANRNYSYVGVTGNFLIPVTYTYM